MKIHTHNFTTEPREPRAITDYSNTIGAYYTRRDRSGLGSHYWPLDHTIQSVEYTRPHSLAEPTCDQRS